MIKNDRREGAGPKVKTWRFKIGDIFYLRDGNGPGEKGEIVQIERTRLTIKVGDREIIIVR